MPVKNETIFPAKLLLFGEYSILLGSSALSMPFKYFGASLKFIGHETGDLLAKAVDSNQQLKKMHCYFDFNSAAFNNFLDLKQLSSDINNGLYLTSTIPQRYGMGSSGALCAAIYDNYNIEYHSPLQQVGIEWIVPLRNSFIRMESFFHGKSSGFDPLVSWFKTSLLLSSDGVIAPVDFHMRLMSENGIEVLLIDSGQPCSTGPLVSDFLSDFAPDGMVTAKGEEFCGLVNSAIEKLLISGREGLWDEIHQLSKFQSTNLDRLIPATFRHLWVEGLKTGLFTLKLCGSGGGGFMLCFTKQKDAAINFFHDKKISVIEV